MGMDFRIWFRGLGFLRVLGSCVDPVQSEMLLGSVFAGFDKAKGQKIHGVVVLSK